MNTEAIVAAILIGLLVYLALIWLVVEHDRSNHASVQQRNKDNAARHLQQLAQRAIIEEAVMARHRKRQRPTPPEEIKSPEEIEWERQFRAAMKLIHDYTAWLKARREQK